MSFEDLWGTLGIAAKLGVLIALTTVGFGVACAIRPDERRLALMRPLSLATIFAALCTFSGGAASILKGIASTGALNEQAWRRVAQGTAEGFMPLFIAFGCLTVAWILVATGLRRG
jgi:hypothetical protein